MFLDNAFLSAHPFLLLELSNRCEGQSSPSLFLVIPQPMCSLGCTYRTIAIEMETLTQIHGLGPSFSLSGNQS